MDPLPTSGPHLTSHGSGCSMTVPSGPQEVTPISPVAAWGQVLA